MKDFFIVIIIVAAVVVGYYYVYPFVTLSYDYAKSICEENVISEEVFGVLPRYYVATGDRWKGDILTGVYIPGSQKEIEINDLKGTFNTREGAIEHCILYFKKYNRE